VRAEFQHYIILKQYAFDNEGMFSLIDIPSFFLFKILNTVLRCHKPITEYLHLKIVLLKNEMKTDHK